MNKIRIKVVILVAVILLILFLPFLPIPKGVCEDGGTRVYSALTYKIVRWNRLQAEMKEDFSGGEVKRYRKTSVFWFPDNFKSIDELWKIESRNN